MEAFGSASPCRLTPSPRSAISHADQSCRAASLSVCLPDEEASATATSLVTKKMVHCCNAKGFFLHYISEFIESAKAQKKLHLKVYCIQFSFIVHFICKNFIQLRPRIQPFKTFFFCFQADAYLSIAYSILHTITKNDSCMMHKQ